MAKFDINILGCGSALPTIRHGASSQVLDIRDKLYMIDCGEGTQLRLRQHHIKFTRLNHIFISHLHGDHCFGLPGLVSTLGMLGRLGDLTIHGPKELKNYMTPILNLFCQHLPYKVILHIIDPKKRALIMEDHSIKVYSIPLKHRVPCCGYLVEEKPTSAHIIREMTDFYKIPVFRLDRIREGADFVTPEGNIIPNHLLTRPADPAKRYAYCSDTLPLESVIEQVQGVDLLYHEATFGMTEKKRAKETGHSTAAQAADIANRAKVEQLMLGHYSARYEDITPLEQEAKCIFKNTIMANEGMCISLK